MWILTEYFGMKHEKVLVPVDEKRGLFVLNEILQGGNFGKYDTIHGINSAKVDWEEICNGCIVIGDYCSIFLLKLSRNQYSDYGTSSGD